MGRATEELAHRAGPGIGGLLNVTFGNAPELIIALFALHEGPAGGRQGLDHRLDPRQPAARDGRRDAGRRLGTRAQQVRRRGGRRAGDDAAAGDGRARAAGDVPARARRRAARSSARRRRTSRTTVEHMSFAVAIVLLLSYFAGLVVLAEDPSRRLQPGHRGGGHRRARLEHQEERRPARGRGRGRRRHVRDPRRLDRGGVRGHRALARSSSA